MDGFNVAWLIVNIAITGIIAGLVGYRVGRRRLSQGKLTEPKEGLPDGHPFRTMKYQDLAEKKAPAAPTMLEDVKSLATPPSREAEMAELLRKLRTAAEKQGIYNRKMGQQIMNSNDALYDHYSQQKRGWEKTVKNLTAQAIDFGASPEAIEETLRF